MTTAMANLLHLSEHHTLMCGVAHIPIVGAYIVVDMLHLPPHECISLCQVSSMCCTASSFRSGELANLSIRAAANSELLMLPCLILTFHSHILYGPREDLAPSLRARGDTVR